MTQTDYSNPGTYNFESVVTEFQSTSGRMVPVRITFPINCPHAPLIVFSHGYLGSEDGYRSLTKNWASYGFVVIQPRHADSLTGKSPEERRRAASFTDPTAFGDPRQRVDEVRECVDHAAGWARQYGFSADTARLVVAGHSYGGLTTELAAGAKPRRLQVQPERRALGYMVLSGQGIGRMFSEESFSSLTKPMLVVSGDNDTLGKIGVLPDQNPISRKDPFLLSPGGNKWLLWLKDAHHDLGGMNDTRYYKSGPHDEEMLGALKGTTTAFLLSLLKSDTAAQQAMRRGLNLPSQHQLISR
ncbi:MAG: hypothetical protein JSS72_08960 [Armatimonadetes bacterium]|nr:hypothetical protein [Armatimonadota bacterium]